MGRGTRPYLLGFALSCVLASPALGLDQYLCIGEQSTGFMLKNGKWSRVKFNVDKDRYLVKEVPPYKLLNETVNFVVQRFGETGNHLTCNRAKSGDYVSSRILCGGLMFGMIVDTKTMRFQELFGSGYIQGDNDGVTPSLTIGTCAKL